MKIVRDVQKLWKPILVLLGVTGATSSAGTVLLLLQLNLLNNTAIASHNPNVTHGQNVSGNPIQGSRNTTGQINQPDNSINKSGDISFSKTEIGLIDNSVTTIDNSIDNSMTIINGISNSVTNIEQEMKQLKIEQPNISKAAQLSIISHEIDHITKLVDEINQTSVTINNQVLNLKRVAGNSTNHSLNNPSLELLVGSLFLEKGQGAESANTNNGTDSSEGMGGILGTIESGMELGKVAEPNAAAVPEPSSALGILFALLMAGRYRKQVNRG